MKDLVIACVLALTTLSAFGASGRAYNPDVSHPVVNPAASHVVYNPAAAGHPVYNPANPGNPMSAPGTMNGRPFNPAINPVAPVGLNQGRNNVQPPFCNDADNGRPVAAHIGQPCVAR